MTTKEAAVTAIPTLTTKRLVLRPLDNADVPGFVEIWSDPEFTRYIGGRSDPDSVWHAMAGNIGCWALTGVGPWAVVERSTGSLVGRAGLWTEPGWPGVEAVWFIRRDRWGRGYAREAANAAIGWAFAQRPDLDEVVAVILPDNTASVRVAERLGMTPRRLEFIHGEDHAVYTISQADWSAALRGLPAVPAVPAQAG
ncbi:GNAT family N-acetyltransferase [Candidatus Frankia alpina]|uniref:GNAT family N-acetyltransferase n=1 Tax=Candidatus Frankia alpina TaxID=2699483 RepID=A0A4S5DC31_9ACTN|nr:GNAT family N-acetyltransferase [Candidatus Frankia alpina]THJ54148.1 GNAT family N-acetyltransferase [Candidatus Frankia alpina]